MAERDVRRARQARMSLGAWLVSAPQMKSKSSNGLKRQVDASRIYTTARPARLVRK